MKPRRLGLIGSLLTLLAGAGAGTTSGGGLPPREAFARRHEAVVRQQLVAQLGIDSSTEAVQAYLLAEHPQGVSPQAFAARRAGWLLLADALTAVIRGAEPDDVFVSSGLQVAGVDPATWAFYAQQAATEAFVASLRRRAAGGYAAYLSEVAESARGAYVEARIVVEVCRRPEIELAIQDHFASLYPPHVAAPPPLPGEWDYHCRRRARAWVLAFARRSVGPVDSRLEGWERSLALLAAWDEGAGRLAEPSPPAPPPSRSPTGPFSIPVDSPPDPESARGGEGVGRHP